MGSVDSLRGQRIYLDTNIVIYILEQVGDRRDVIERLVDFVAQGECDCVTAELTATEVLPGVARTRDEEAVERCLQFFESGDVLELKATGRDTFYKAGLLRARSNLTTPDAIHLMTAIEHGCSVFLTNDKQMRSVAGIRVIQLSELQV